MGIPTAILHPTEPFAPTSSDGRIGAIVLKKAALAEV